MQKDVAAQLGISRKRYAMYELGDVDSYPKDIMDKLFEIYEVPLDDLLDEYNRFLYKGQGRLIREYREMLGLQKRPFARMLHIAPNTLRAWESEAVQINVHSWEKHFKGVISA